MASPTSNSTPVSTYTVPSTNSLASLLDGTKWGSGAVGSGVTLTYSFATTSSTYSYRYEWAQGSALSTTEQAAVREALSGWAAVADITFTEVTETSSVVGELRFAESRRVDTEGASAWSYMPDSGTWAGDTWISPTLFSSTASVSPGGWNYMVLVHEIGHSLGLKHPFEASTASSATLPTSEDTYHYTVMSYSATAGNSNVSASIYPTTPMLYDIAAVQYLYGANYDTNAGNTTYTYSGTGSYLETIWDGGGTDTIVYSSTTGGVINLNAGSFSQLGKAVTYSNNTSNANTVAIAYDCVIENATGGSGNDTIFGNSSSNTVAGGSGTDVLLGNVGSDQLAGGDGSDVIFGGRDSDILLGNTGNDTLSGDDGNDTLFGGRDNDSLTGGTGNDLIYGDSGSDTVVSGLGSDVIVLNSLDGIDTVTDFDKTADTLWLTSSVFGTLATGGLSAQSLVNGTSALDANDYVLFDGATGSLWYDADGSGQGAAVKLATLSGVSSLTASSIYIV